MKILMYMIARQKLLNTVSVRCVEPLFQVQLQIMTFMVTIRRNRIDRIRIRQAGGIGYEKRNRNKRGVRALHTTETYIQKAKQEQGLSDGEIQYFFDRDYRYDLLLYFAFCCKQLGSERGYREVVKLYGESKR